MFEMLKSFGFSDTFIKWISILYKDISSSIIVNQCISDSFGLTRSVRQGCSLSPLLYVLCLEPFARIIQNHDIIKGIPTPDNVLHVKMSPYADDYMSILTSDQSIVRFVYHVANFERVSGSKINYKKSNGVFLCKWKDRSDHLFGIS